MISNIRSVNMKKLMTMVFISIIIIAGCSSGKYADEIDKAVNQQKKQQKLLADKQKGDVESKFEKKNANIYVYDKGKYVTIAYKPLKEDDEVHFYTYKITDNKAHYLKNFNSKSYSHAHDADYKEENMNLEE